MIENAAEMIRNAFEDLLRDKKALVRILSIVIILLLAMVLRIHDSNKADINVSAPEESVSELSDSASEDEPAASRTLYVDIGGAVEKPGVYQVAEGTRLYEVVELAGGLDEEADTDSVNQAAFVEDGQKVIIPKKGAAPEGSASSGAAAAADSSSISDGLININTASKDDLKRLKGIGDVTAEKIIEYRSSNTFKSKEDIMSVKGIGTGIYENIKDDITV